MLGQLPFFLTWRYYWDLPVLAQSVCEYFVALGWERWLASLRQADPATHAEVTGLLDALPEDSRRRFLTAPESYRLLCTPSHRSVADDIAFVQTSLLAEQARLGLARPATGVCWTALGDACFTAAEGGLGRYEAPALAAAIVVDTHSPHAYLEANPAACGEPVAGDELAALMPALAAAGDRLRAVSEDAYDNFRTSVRVITVRRERTTPEVSSSSSWPWLIGKMGLANPWATSGERRTAILVNAMVHESIHSLVYRIELVDPLYTSLQAGQEVVALSPWSGRELRLHSFVHACFVWFGLWSFWTLAAASGVFSPSTARELIDSSARGFRHPDMAGRLSALAPHLTPGALAAIRRLHRIVLERESLPPAA